VGADRGVVLQHGANVHRDDGVLRLRAGPRPDVPNHNAQVPAMGSCRHNQQSHHLCRLRGTEPAQAIHQVLFPVATVTTLLRVTWWWVCVTYMSGTVCSVTYFAKGELPIPGSSTRCRPAPSLAWSRCCSSSGSNISPTPSATTIIGFHAILLHLCLILICSNSPSSLLCHTDRRAGFHDRPKAVGEVWTSQVTSCHACTVSSRARDINGAVHIPLNRLLLAKHAIAFGAGRRNVIDQRQQSPSVRALVIGSGQERWVCVDYRARPAQIQKASAGASYPYCSLTAYTTPLAWPQPSPTYLLPTQ